MTAKPGIEFLPAGSELARWIRAGGRPDRASALHTLAYRWRGWWFDHNWATQCRLHPTPSEPPDAIFVLGFWRSGTTFLHELLTAGVGAEAPRTWQCFDPSAFLLRPAPGNNAAVQRPMDAGVISAHSPQEDEFALMARGATSAYRFFLDPRRWRELLPTLTPEFWQSDVSPAWLAELRTFLHWCVPGTNRTLVVKSPNHIFRAAALRRHWPEARCVWIFRDPEQLWHSNLRMWRAMVERYALWQWREDDLVQFVSACFRAYERLLGQFPGGHAALRFEDLVASPSRCLQDVATRLNTKRGMVSTLPSPTPSSDSVAARVPGEIQGLLRSIRQQQHDLISTVNAAEDVSWH